MLSDLTGDQIRTQLLECIVLVITKIVFSGLFYEKDTIFTTKREKMKMRAKNKILFSKLFPIFALLLHMADAKDDFFNISQNRHLIVGAFRVRVSYRYQNTTCRTSSDPNCSCNIQSPLAFVPNSLTPPAGAILEVDCLKLLANVFNFT